MTYAIGDAAQLIGVESHVLRHWEDMHLLEPARARSGHRRYSADDIDRARLIRRLQPTGLALADIRDLLEAGGPMRRRLLEQRVAQLRRAAAEAASTISFLEHTLRCEHRVVADCPDCAEFAGGGRPLR